MTLEELKVEAKNQGYKLIKDTTTYEKFLPCKCGHNRRKRCCGFYNSSPTYFYIRYECTKCGYYVDGKNEKEAKHNWNEKMRGD